MVGFFSRCAYNTLLETELTLDILRRGGTGYTRQDSASCGGGEVQGRKYWILDECIIFSSLVCGEYLGAIFSLGIGLKVWHFSDFLEHLGTGWV